MTNPSRTSPLLVAAALLMTSACGGGDAPPPEEETETSGTEVVAEREPEPPPEPTPPAPSPVRVIHVAAAAHQTALSGTAEGAQGEYGELAYQTPSAYIAIQPAAGATSAAFTFGAEGGASVQHTAELSAATPSTLFLITSAEDPAQVVVTGIADEAGTVTGQARGRFVNALMGAAALDLCIPGASRRDAGRAIFSNVAYGDVGGIPSFPSRYQPMTLAGVESVQIRTANAEAPCSGAIIGNAALPPVDHNLAHNLTLIAVGNSGRSPRVPKQLLVCEDAPGSGACVPVPLAR